MRRALSISTILIYILVSLFTVVSFLPMLLTIMVSLTDEATIMANGYSFFPEKISTYAYWLMFQGRVGAGYANVINSYFISAVVTLIGTGVAVLITAMAAYALANRQLRYGNALALYFFITIIFYSGIVPWYMLNRALGLRNNLAAMILPSLLFNAFNLFLVRNFMYTIPDSLRQSATIDGANDALICFRIYFPLSVPVLATVALFYGLAYWNDWWNAIMLVEKETLLPLQYLMFKLRSQISMIRQMSAITGVDTYKAAPTESIKMATAVVTIGPIVLLYPLLQKYFVKGLILGSVKG